MNFSYENRPLSPRGTYPVHNSNKREEIIHINKCIYVCAVLHNALVDAGDNSHNELSENGEDGTGGHEMPNFVDISQVRRTQLQYLFLEFYESNVD
ncbi:hypothetical protein O181_019619 [Austropuccinia psidii MF-1]|uniref:Uncharacterized protein n=1 Tax=Austropuccinia psidii MF-1 TaxID=1389203 RepID=A0A9Q3GUX1_9BASI|nr:hypothetical protein [Austropuccinia psidii MF-1]